MQTRPIAQTLFVESSFTDLNRLFLGERSVSQVDPRGKYFGALRCVLRSKGFHFAGCCESQMHSLRRVIAKWARELTAIHISRV